MAPAVVVRLLERAVQRRAENAVNWPRGRELAAATEPLAFRDVRHAVALLVHRKIAQVAEQNRVRIRALETIDFNTSIENKELAVLLKFHKNG